jgi:hypothetical protein
MGIIKALKIVGCSCGKLKSGYLIWPGKYNTTKEQKHPSLIKKTIFAAVLFCTKRDWIK